ncbi:hypothetical protein BJ165DRAFT_1474169 [Panaeolus papilionaceus]|nr:hypothetical protein BJ165DRAFT_1474169 [Panaeolus papilionaceus]
MGCRFPNVTSLQLQLRRDRFGYSPAISLYAFPSLQSLVINDDSFLMKTVSSLGTCRTITDLTIFSHNLTIAHHFHRFAKECGGGLPLPSLRNLQLRIIGVECFKAASEDTLWFAHREIESLIEIKQHRPSINISIHWLIPYLSMSHVRYPHFVDYEDPSGCSPVEVFINLEKSFFDVDGSNFGIDTQIVQVDYNRVFDLFQEHPVTWFR